MDNATLGGLIGGFLLIFIAIFLGGEFTAFLDTVSIIIVLGGAIAATAVNHPVSDLKSAIKVASIAFKEKKVDEAELIQGLISLAERARREGLLALEDMAASMEPPFFAKLPGAGH